MKRNNSSWLPLKMVVKRNDHRFSYRAVRAMAYAEGVPLLDGRIIAKNPSKRMLA